MSMTRLALGVICGAALTAVSANAATIDFTDDDFVNGAFNEAARTTVTVSAINGVLTLTNFDGSFAPNDQLAFDNDGFGVNDDEVSNSNTDEELVVTFGNPITVTGLFFLDLFEDPNSVEQETAFVEFSDGTVLSFPAEVQFGANAGFGFFMLDDPILTTTLSFTAGSENDGQTLPDFAVAGVEVEPIPLPAAGWMFLGALGGLGLIARRRGA